MDELGRLLLTQFLNSAFSSSANLKISNESDLGNLVSVSFLVELRE